MLNIVYKLQKLLSFIEFMPLFRIAYVCTVYLLFNDFAKLQDNNANAFRAFLCGYILNVTRIVFINNTRNCSTVC